MDAGQHNVPSCITFSVTVSVPYESEVARKASGKSLTSYATYTVVHKTFVT